MQFPYVLYRAQFTREAKLFITNNHVLEATKYYYVIYDYQVYYILLSFVFSFETSEQPRGFGACSIKCLTSPLALMHLQMQSLHHHHHWSFADIWLQQNSTLFFLFLKMCVAKLFPQGSMKRRMHFFCSLPTPNKISQTPSRHPYCTSKTTYQINPTCWGKLNQATATEKIAVMM